MWKRVIVSVLIVTMAGGLIGGMYKSVTGKTMQAGIAQEVLRFHVLANSDNKQDQELKMKVKQEVIESMTSYLTNCENLKETREQIAIHQDDIKKVAQKIICQEGYSYQVTVELGRSYFPVKSYGDCTFPAGWYEALRIVIGQGKGHNWWCILYPNLCFIDPCYGEVEAEEKEKLENVLTDEEYQSILEVPQENITIESRFFDWIQEIFSGEEDEEISEG